MSSNNFLCICTSCRDLIKKHKDLHLALKYETCAYTHCTNALMCTTTVCMHMDTVRQNLKVQLRGLLSLYNASHYHIFQWLSASLWLVTDEGSSVMPIRNYNAVTLDLSG